MNADASSVQRFLSYPLRIAVNSYRGSLGRFGANHANGRKHAGCDWYANPGTPVYAVKSGTATAVSFEFCSGRHAGPLTDRKNSPTLWRKDLQNPTWFLTVPESIAGAP